MEKNNNTAEKKAPADDKKPGFKRSFGKKPGGPKRGFKKNAKPRDEFEQKIVDLARVTRVMAGGKRMKFRACMIVGDKMGKVGVGIAKGADVSAAISKAVSQAKKHLVDVPIVNGTVPHEITIKQNSARLLIKPAKKGSGLKAGGVMRIVFELVGVKDAVGKIIGSNNKVNNSKALIKALSSFVPTAVSFAEKHATKKSSAKGAPKAIKMKAPAAKKDTPKKEATEKKPKEKKDIKK